MIGRCRGVLVRYLTPPRGLWRFSATSGAAFLAWFGYESAKRVFTPHAVVVEEGTEDAQSLSCGPANHGGGHLPQPAGLVGHNDFPRFWLNTQGDPGRWWYYLGCCCGSVLWFLMIGYGSF